MKATACATAWTHPCLPPTLPTTAAARRPAATLPLATTSRHRPTGGRLPSTVYGAEHLLRLFVKLPELLAQSSLPPTAAPFMQSVLSDVLRYIAANQSSLLLTPKDKYQPRGSSAGQAQQAQE